MRRRYYNTYNTYNAYNADAYRNDNDSDDGYDAARDAYNMGYGEPVTRRQREEEEMLREEDRRNRW